ncbi:MAG: class I SAM-dependent methyltransferase [Anaerolineales bacterium]
MDSQEKLPETVEEALNELSAGYVLDVATGNGGFISYLIENLKDYTEITGIDCNQRPLETAEKSHEKANIRFQLMDAARMDFPDDHFDTVCISNSLHHMADLPGVLSEMVRVCKPGGQLIFCEMYRDGQTETQLTHMYLHHWWAAVDSAEGITHFETFTRRQVVEIIERLGLQNMRYYDSKELDSDPKAPELVHELDNIIDRFLNRAKVLESGEDLRLRGELLRLQVHETGFHGATSLIAIGEK